VIADRTASTFTGPGADGSAQRMRTEEGTSRSGMVAIFAASGRMVPQSSHTRPGSFIMLEESSSLLAT
jgi:hypothetical protein